MCGVCFCVLRLLTEPWAELYFFSSSLYFTVVSICVSVKSLLRSKVFTFVVNSVKQLSCFALNLVKKLKMGQIEKKNIDCVKVFTLVLIFLSLTCVFTSGDLNNLFVFELVVISFLCHCDLHISCTVCCTVGTTCWFSQWFLGLLQVLQFPSRILKQVQY